MAKAKVVHMEAACHIIFEGNPKRHEPQTGVIQFPGGHVEVTRTGSGYWAHVSIDTPSDINQSRIDYTFDGYVLACEKIPDVPHAEHIQHIALHVEKKT
jgi:hypothetical protein